MRLPVSSLLTIGGRPLPTRGGRRGGDRETTQDPSRRAAEEPGAGADPRHTSREGAAPPEGSSGEVNEAPDFAEPLEAWRVWKVVRRDGVHSLGSVIQRTVWPGGRGRGGEGPFRRA